MAILRIKDEAGNIISIPAIKGEPGKSAYEYAKDGGYTGTEEEFKAKMAKEIQTTLPNPYKLIFQGAVTAEYDGSGAVTVTIPSGNGGSVTERIEKLSTDTEVELQPNKLYIFPEMDTLTYTLAEISDNSVLNEYHFVFQSGVTATEVVHPESVNIGSFAVEANKIYEISIMEGLLTSQNWAVS